MDNKTINFVIRMQNMAKATVAAFGRDLKGAAGEARKATGDINAASKAANDLGKQAKAAAAQTTQAAKAARAANFKDAFDRGAAAAKGMGVQVTRLRGLLAGVAAAALLKGTIDEYIKFETKISEFSAVTGTAGAALDDVRKKAQEMVAGTVYSATQAADAMTVFARAGATTQGSIDAAKASIDGATVAGIDMQQMATIVISTLNQFGQSADRAADAVDVLSKVDNISAADMKGLGEALSYSGTVANSAGVSFNTLAGALGVLGDAGTKGSRAGTEMQNVISRMINVLPNAEKQLKKLGLTAKDLDAQDIPGTFKKLSAAGMTTKDALIIFGEEGGRAATILAAQTEKLDRFIAATKDAGNTAANAAKVMKDNLGGDFERLTAQAKALAIQIGEAGVGNALRGIVQILTGGASAFGDFLEWLQSGSVSAGIFQGALFGIAAGFAAAGIAAGIAAIPFGLLSTAIGVLLLDLQAMAVALLTNPLTIIPAIVALAVGAIVAFGTTTQDVNGKLVSGWSVLRAYFNGMVAGFIALMSGLGKAFYDTFAGMAKMAVGFGKVLIAAASGDGQGVIAAYNEAMGGGRQMLAAANRDIGVASGKAFNEAYAKTIRDAPRVVAKDTKKTGSTRKPNTVFTASTPIGNPNLADPTGTGKKGGSDKGKEDPFPRQLDQLIKQLMPAAQRVRELKDNEALLLRGRKEGKLTAEQYAQAMGVLKDRASEENDTIGKTTSTLMQQRAVFGVAVKDRDLYNQQQELDNQLRRDGLAYMKNGVLVMSDDVKVRRAAVLALQAQNQGLADQDQLNQSLAEAAADTKIELEATTKSGYAKERYIAVQKRYNEALQKYHGNAVLAKQASDALGQSMDELRAAQEASAGNWQQGILNGLGTWMKDVRDVASATSSAIGQQMDNMADMFSTWATTGKLAIGDFVRSAMADITRLISKILLMKAIQAGANALGFTIPTFHTGGVVGQASAASQYIRPDVLHSLPRYHEGGRVPGLSKDERMAVLLTGERVLNRDQNRAYEAGMVAGGLGGGGRSGSGGGGNSYTFSSSNTYSLGDGGNGGGGDMTPAQMDKFSKMMDETVNTAVQRKFEQEMRPGGMLAGRRG